ncbi:hypothetical protein BKA81DRAFT_113553 [Phyllosticta paracitricarpa]
MSTSTPAGCSLPPAPAVDVMKFPLPHTHRSITLPCTPFQDCEPQSPLLLRALVRMRRRRAPLRSTVCATIASAYHQSMYSEKEMWTETDEATRAGLSTKSSSSSSSRPVRQTDRQTRRHAHARRAHAGMHACLRALCNGWLFGSYFPPSLSSPDGRGKRLAKSTALAWRSMAGQTDEGKKKKKEKKKEQSSVMEGWTRKGMRLMPLLRRQTRK